MPSEAKQAELQQPWVEWSDQLAPKEAIGNEGLLLSNSRNDESTKHGTVALYPRHDIDFSKPKVREAECKDSTQ